MEDKAMYYSDYLQLKQLLNSQHPKSFSEGNTPAHDEMLFIIIHQSYELWFKQILFELDYVMDVFNKEKINDNSEDLNLVRHRLHRVIRILELLTQQVHILDTMTPLDFLEFRNLLTPSSGFQSLQFRLIEAKLGLRLSLRHQHDYYKRVNEGGFTTKDFAAINKIEEEFSLLQQINRWLERMPFFQEEYWKTFDVTTADDDSIHPFWTVYRSIYSKGLSEREKGKLQDFDYVFFEKANPIYSTEQLELLRQSLSPAAMRAALFILVETKGRMIGLRVGTGNTSGSGYLEGALNKHYIYKDLSGLSTYLIERKKLPQLPVELIKQLSFANV
jgi:tryptophan 2,3-dioxygenase